MHLFQKSNALYTHFFKRMLKVFTQRRIAQIEIESSHLNIDVSRLNDYRVCRLGIRWPDDPSELISTTSTRSLST